MKIKKMETLKSNQKEFCKICALQNYLFPLSFLFVRFMWVLCNRPTQTLNCELKGG